MRTVLIMIFALSLASLYCGYEIVRGVDFGRRDAVQIPGMSSRPATTAR